MSRRVLVITYFFPPVGGVGVIRTLKHVTYLPRWGWEPIVVAPRDPAYPLRDPSLLEAVPAGLEVHRTLSLEPARLLIHGASWLRWAPKFGPPAEPDSPSARSSGPNRMARLKRAGAMAWSRAWETVLFPDQAVAWSPSAWLAGRRVIQRDGADAIYSSGPPMSVHLTAGLLRRQTGLPWVADFRDPWIDNPFREPRSKVRDLAERRLERWVVDRADRVVLAMDMLRDAFVRRYPDQADKFVHLPNGYDRSDLRRLAVQVQEPGLFRLVYAGSLYRPQELSAFLGGVEVLFRRRPELRSRLTIDFVGRVNEANAKIAASFSRAERLGDAIQMIGFVPRTEALARMAGASALLQLMLDDEKAAMFVGGKLYEYLQFDRPILAVMPPGEGRTLVEALPSGRSADPQPEAVADALERLLDDPPPPARSDPDGKYDRVNLARRLGVELDAVAAEHTGGRQGSA